VSRNIEYLPAIGKRSAASQAGRDPAGTEPRPPGLCGPKPLKHADLEVCAPPPLSESCRKRDIVLNYANPLALFAFALVLLISQVAAGASARFVPGQILIKPRPQLSDTELGARLRVHGAARSQSLRHLNVRVINVAEDQAETVLAALRNDPGIEFAERDGIARAAFVANDPYVVSGTEWHLAKIQAPQAWGLTPGIAQTIVAVLDSGINAAHPDLAGRILPGYNLVWGDSDPSDDFGHGTAVAGVVAAQGNNGVGVAGVAYGCSILPVKVLDASGFASYSCLAQGIRYAVEQGARVINISIAGEWPSQTLQEAINFAWSNNVIVVAAAGNSGSSIPQYPAACAHVIAVSATEPDDSLASFSSYGNHIALSAPGDNIWTTQRDLAHPYGSWRGTSFASPVVAAVAGLIISANPSLSNTQIVSILEQTADSAPASGYDPRFGDGRVNALKAVAAANPELASENTAASGSLAVNLTSPADGSQFALGDPVRLSATVLGNTETFAGVEFRIDGVTVQSCTVAPFASEWTPPQGGTFSLTAVALDNQGIAVTSAAVTIVISKMDTTAPRIRITHPTATRLRVEDSLLDMQGIAGDSTGVQRVEVQIEDGPVQIAAGTTNWSIQLNLAPGPNHVRIRAVDLDGNVSSEISRTFTFVVPALLSVQTNGCGKVVPDLDGRLLEVGQTYTVKAVPGRGQLFAGWEGLPSAPRTLTFLMQSNLCLVANFVPTPFAEIKGSYAGLLADTNGVTADNSGYFRLAVTRMGHFSGRLFNSGRNYGFTGTFDLSGDANVTVQRGSLAALRICLHLDLTNDTDQVTGSVTGGGWAAQLDGDRNVYKATRSAAQQAGVHSFVLEPSQAPSTNAASGISRIAKNGTTRVRGKLNDGRRFGLGSLLAKNGDCPVYLPFNRGKEVVIGWLNFPANPESIASGTVVWVNSGTNAFATMLKATGR
jgi:thermitase